MMEKNPKNKQKTDESNQTRSNKWRSRHCFWIERNNSVKSQDVKLSYICKDSTQFQSKYEQDSKVFLEIHKLILKFISKSS